jgi:hypothetical protein
MALKAELAAATTRQAEARGTLSRWLGIDKPGPL